MSDSVEEQLLAEVEQDQPVEVVEWTAWWRSTPDAAGRWWWE